MPTSRQVPFVGNPFGLASFTSTNEQTLLECVNNSGGTLKHGDVVVVDVTGRLVTSTTVANDPATLGVVSVTGSSDVNGGTIADQQTCWVCVGGVARVNIAANTVASGGVLAASTAAKVAAVPAAAGSVAALQAFIGSFIGVALESQAAKDTNNCIRVKMLGPA